MSRAATISPELDLFGGYNPINKLDFRTLYDRYAPALFGFITKAVSDKDEAVGLLEKTFAVVHAELDKFRPEKQPVFAWLLTIARQTVTDALQARSKVSHTAVQLTAAGKVTISATRPIASSSFKTNSTDSQLNELLDSVLFKKCTPEEAARTIGIPEEAARQQLRLAVQQLRLQPQV